MTEVPAIRVRQWLDEWDLVPTDSTKFQSPPPREFYVTSMRASDLRALSDVHQRDASVVAPRAEDPYVQRTLEHDRTSEIREYIRVGYPLSSLGKRRMLEEERNSLRKPGWLPTAIIANVIPVGDRRGDLTVADRDCMSISSGDGENTPRIHFPSSWSEHGWSPSGAFPLEIIDGQHRLSAFDDGPEDENFELPVVLFEGLDFSWQAYLFWTVNIKPKRINGSLAYDLYPLLREQDWLEAGESLNVYRETRAQELAEVLWADPKSVWYDRINMLGQAGMKSRRPVTQAAFVRSLTSSLIRPFKGYRGLGGIFGGAADRTGFNWPRGQQAALLMYAWNALAHAISNQPDLAWASVMRHASPDMHELWRSDDPLNDPAFVSDKTLLASDQGVRGFHLVLNDLLYVSAGNLRLSQWAIREDVEADAQLQLHEAYAQLETNSVGSFIARLCDAISGFDWRNSRATELSSDERELKLALRGSGGYNVLRDRVLRFLEETPDPDVAEAARRVTSLRA